MYQPNFNIFDAMNSYSTSMAPAPPSQYRHHQQQQPMMNLGYNMFAANNQSSSFSKSTANYNFMASQRNNFPMSQSHQPSFNLPSLPSSSGFMPSMNYAGNSQTFSIVSSDSKEPDNAREVFFRTLMTSLKEANRCYSGKTTSWKNPFMYKTTICDNYRSRGYCRYGVNCWYAHGAHELRCIPESDDLPDRDFITQYLSFLGLPKNVLDDIITHGYKNAQLYIEHQWLKSAGKSPGLSSFGSTNSSPPPPHSPINNPPPSLTSNLFGPVGNGFGACMTSNGDIAADWDSICTAFDRVGAVDETQVRNNFTKSFRLFRETDPAKRD